MISFADMQRGTKGVCQSLKFTFMRSLLFTLMLVMFFCACKKTSEHYIKNDITGTWKLVQYKGDTSNPPTPILDGMLLVLNSNNTFEYKIFFDRTVQTGTYELGRKKDCSGGAT